MDNCESFDVCSDLLVEGKFSTIDLSGDNGIEFGSVFLRHILKRIKQAKENREYNVPILIIIDEAHKFHSRDQGTKEALNYLDDICRTGRTNKIGIIFASQDLATIPKGLINIVNSIIAFRNPDNSTARKFDVSTYDMNSMKDGYAVALLHKNSHVKYIKFPLSVSGVVSES